MAVFYMTFGSQYSYQKHPAYRDAHPNHIVRVEAKDETAAKKLIDRHLAGDYSVLYPEDQLDTFIDYHPNGVTHMMTDSGIQAL